MVVVILASLALLGTARAQQTSSPSAGPAKKEVGARAWREDLSGPASALGAAVLGFVLSWLAGKTTRKRLKLEAETAALTLAAEREALRSPRQPEPESRRCSVLLLGIGGSGKSTLVRSLFGDWDNVEKNIIEPDAEELPSSPKLAGVGAEDKKTRRVRTWHERIPWAGSAVSLSITDYVGQNLGTLVRYFAKEQKNKFSSVAYGYINAVIFVVDLRTPPLVDNPNAEIPFSIEPEMGRIEEHLEAWNWQAISSVWGMLTKPRFKKIIIVVKKWDRLSHFDDSIKRKVRQAYQPLFDNLKLVFPDQEPVYICGVDGSAADEAAQVKSALWAAADDIPRANK